MYALCHSTPDEQRRALCMPYIMACLGSHVDQVSFLQSSEQCQWVLI